MNVRSEARRVLGGWRWNWARVCRTKPVPAGERGSATVELAMVMPVTLILLTGFLSFAVFINNDLELANATSIAGQYLSLNRGTTGAADPCKTTIQTFAQVAPYLQSTKLSFSFVFNGNSYPNATTCTAASAYMVQSATAQITVTYPCSLGIYGVNFAPTCALKSQVTEIIQ